MQTASPGVNLLTSTAQLGDDLWSLVRAINVPLVAVTPLRGAGYPGYEP